MLYVLLSILMSLSTNNFGQVQNEKDLTRKEINVEQPKILLSVDEDYNSF